jgi:hypothetical protein
MIGYVDVGSILSQSLFINIFMPDKDQKEPDIGPDNTPIINKITCFYSAKKKRNYRPDEDWDHQGYKQNESI